MPDPINAADVEGLQDAIARNEQVAQAFALRHAQAHSMLSSSDHSDASGVAATDGQTLKFDAATGKWTPGRLTVDITGVTRIDGGTC